MPALYQICDAIAHITDGDELSPDMEAQLDALELDLSTKVDSCCRLIREWKSEAERFKSEAARLADIADGLAGRADRLKQYVATCLALAGVRKLETELFRLSVCRNSQPSVTVDGDVPEGFRKLSVSLDRDAALAAWRDGTLPAGITVAVGEHLRIK